MFNSGRPREVRGDEGGDCADRRQPRGGPRLGGRLVGRSILLQCVLQRVAEHLLDGAGVREDHDEAPEASDIVDIQGGPTCRVASRHGSRAPLMGFSCAVGHSKGLAVQ